MQSLLKAAIGRNDPLIFIYLMEQI